MASSFRSDDAILSGSLTHLSDGTSYLVAGSGISISTGSNGSVTITNDGTVGDITSVVAGSGLTGGATSGDATLNIGAGTGINVNANDIEVDADGATLTIQTSDIDQFLINDGGTFKRISPHNVNISALNNDSSFIAGVTVQDEGSALSTAGTTINFTGAGVTASGTGATKTVTIPGGGAVSAVANGSNNRVATFSSSDALNGEANLTFDGSTLTVAGSIDVDGSAIFNESGNAVDFRIETDNNPNMFIVKGTTDRVGIGTVSAPQATLHIKESAPTFRIQRSNNGNDSTIEFAGSAGAVGTMVHLASSNDLVFSTHDGVDQEEILRLGGHQISDVRQIILLSGSQLAASAMQPKDASDINFFVSGSIGSKNSTTRGTAVFGGDVVISGSLHGGSPLKISGGMEITGSAQINGDFSINQGNYLRFNNPGDNDQSIRSTADQMVIETDNTLQINADNTVQITVNNSSAADNVELITLDAENARISLKPQKTQINSNYQDSDFLVGGNGEANQGLIYVDGADNSILIGGQNLGFLEIEGNQTPADVAAALGYGSDVKILLSGSVGTKDTSTRGVTLVTSDLVVSGNIYDQNGHGVVKQIDKGQFVAGTVSSNTKYFLPEDSEVESSATSYRNTYVAPYSGSIEKLIIRGGGNTTLSFSPFVGLTGSLHIGGSTVHPQHLDTAPDSQEEVKVSVSGLSAYDSVEFIFTGSNFDPGDIYTFAIQPDQNWDTVSGEKSFIFTTVVSYMTAE